MQVEDLTKRWGVLFVHDVYAGRRDGSDIEVVLMFADSRKKANELKIKYKFVYGVALVFDTWGWEWFIDTMEKAQRMLKRKHNAS